MIDRTQRDKLDRMAISLMELRPDLPQFSLDEWAIEHAPKLTQCERNAAQAIIELYEERDQ